MNNITTLQRFAAYTCLGLLLLVVYQVVFMARTSAARDWNHLHSAPFTLVSLQRLALNSVDESRLAQFVDLLQDIPAETVSPSPFKRSQPYLPKHSAYVAQLASDSTEIFLSRYSSVFGFEGSDETTLTLDKRDVKVASFSAHRSVEEEVATAIEQGKRALIYVCPTDWLPNYGFKVYEIPVVAVHTTPSPKHELELTIKGARETGARSAHWHIPGFTADTLVISDSRSSPESSAIFYELAAVFEYLISRGWQPLRSVHFISHGMHSSRQWAEANKGWLRRRAIAFVDCGQVANTPSLAVSPGLNHTSRWALNQLLDAGLLPEIPTRIPMAPLGSNTLNLDLQVPGISPQFNDPLNTARLLGLIAVTLAQDAILPFYAADYLPFMMDSREFEVAALLFDKDVDNLRFNFTAEYPWYQGMNKFTALVRRKKANLIMRQIEQHLINSHGEHVLFGSDLAGTGTVVKSNLTEIGTAIMHIVSDFLTFP